MSFFDIFGGHRKTEENVVYAESPVICQHKWIESDGEIHIEKNLAHSDAFHRFMKEIGGVDDYHNIDTFHFRRCDKCGEVEMKSRWKSLYGPKNWTSPPDYLMKDLMISSTRIPKITELQDLMKYKIKLVDDIGRLHNKHGPAAIRVSGTKEYWIHGVNIPEKWILRKETISSKDFLEESNVERRRVLMEIIGKDRFVDVLKMTKLNDVFRQGILYELFEKVDQSYGKIHIVRCTTPPEKGGESKSYYLMTPPWLSDVWESVAWTFYETASSYNPEVET